MRLWLASGLMVSDRNNRIVGGLFEAEGEAGALGQLLQREQVNWPGHRAEAFAAVDCSNLVRDFVARHPQ